MRQLELLSDSLREILVIIKEKHNCPIASDLIEADELVKICKRFENYSHYSESYCICSEITEEKIHRYINNEARMLSFRYNEFAISYLPKDKEAIYSDSNNKIWSRQNRVTAKPARIIQKLLVNKYMCKQYEDFSNYLKAEITNFGEFELVSGKDITKWYNEDNYYKREGTLGNSCMRYSNCSGYFQIYEENAEMLIYLKDNLLLGRAIIWTINNQKYMDRVYTCFDHLYNIFIDYAKEKKWVIREDNSLLYNGDSQGWLLPDDEYSNRKYLNLSFTTRNSYKFYPYMDSFRYFNRDTNELFCNVSNNYTCALSNTDGYIEDEYSIYQCDMCGYSERAADSGELCDLVYSEYEDMYLCPLCRTFCDGIDDYVRNSREIVAVDHGLNYPLDYIKEDKSFINIKDEWYTKEYYETEILPKLEIKEDE